MLFLISGCLLRNKLEILYMWNVSQMDLGITSEKDLGENSVMNWWIEQNSCTYFPQYQYVYYCYS
jgi:hypothetical protein